MNKRHRPIFGEPLIDILRAGEAVLSVHCGNGRWRHFGLAKEDSFDRDVLIGDLERGTR